MKIYPSVDIRNVGIVSHGGAGKTSLSEALVFNTGVIKRLGKVDEGNTIADYHPEEVNRKMTINTSLIACEWKDKKVNLLDTPGFSDFFGEVKSTLRVTDSIVMVVDAVSGVQVSTDIIWDLADKANMSRFVFINKMDRENADFFRVVKSMQDKLTKQIIPIQIPIGAEANFSGIVDLIDMKAFTYDDGISTEIEISDEMMQKIKQHREKLIEAAAEGDDELILKYLEGEELTNREIIQGLKIGIISGKIVPVLCGSAINNIASDKLLDVLVNYAPNPLDKVEDKSVMSKPVAALIFKTMADPYVGKINYFKVFQNNFTGDSNYFNASKQIDEKVSHIYTMQGKNQIQMSKFEFGDIGVIPKLTETSTGDTFTTRDSEVILDGIEFPVPTFSVAIDPKTKGDEDKLGNALNRLLEEDPTLRLEKNVETKQTLLTAMGEAHIDIVLERLKRKFGVEVTVVAPKVPYRETIKGTASKVEGKHKKQSGGSGQYGHVFIDMSPFPDGDLEFNQKIFGGSVPKQYIPAVEKGIRESMGKGTLAGYPVTNIKVTLTDGSYHTVDSNEMAFKIAASIAFKKALEQAKTVLLEPIMNIEVIVPDQFFGDIMSDFTSKRGRILGMEQNEKLQIIKAQAPLSEMYRYSIDLKSITQGRGAFLMEFSHYEEVPTNIAEKIIAESKAE